METLKNKELSYLKSVLENYNYKLGYQHQFKKVVSANNVTDEVQLLAYNLKTGVILICETLYNKINELRVYLPNVNGLNFSNTKGFKSGSYRQLELSIEDIDDAFNIIDSIIKKYSTSNIWDESNIIRLHTSQDAKNAFNSNISGLELYNNSAERLLMVDKEIDSILCKCKTLESIFNKRIL